MEQRFKKILDYWQDNNKHLVSQIKEDSTTHRNVRRARCDYDSLAYLIESTHNHYWGNYNLPPFEMLKGWIKKARSINKRLERWLPY